MSNSFFVPEDSPPPSTPGKSAPNLFTTKPSNPFSSSATPKSKNATPSFAANPSTTPAGPPPTADKSFTPAGQPSASFLGSSMMRGVGGSPSGGSGGSGKGKSPVISSRNMFAGGKGKGAAPSRGSGAGVGVSSPLGRSVRGLEARPSKPSRLRQVFAESESEEDADVGEEEEEEEVPRGRTAARDEEEDDAEGEDEEVEDDAMDDAEGEEDAEGDVWLDLDSSNRRPDQLGDDEDMLMFATPAANDRIRKEAESLFRSTAKGLSREQEFNYATLIKDTYSQFGYASIVETAEVILKTEDIVSGLYEEGIGTVDDDERLDTSLANAAGSLASLWWEYANTQPESDEEHAAEIGPGPQASSFKKANYLATLALQLHHTRRLDGHDTSIPLPEVLFSWLADHHNPYASQIDEVSSHRPPASHSMFWQTIFVAVLRGNVSDALGLLDNAGWQHVRSGREGRAYEGKALLNVQTAARDTAALLRSCPGHNGNWDIWTSDWTLFRIRAAGALESLRRLAEGRERRAADDDEDASGMDDSFQGSRQSMSGLARKAESHLPWEIYENLQIVFEIVLGVKAAIMGSAQDWVEATAGLLGWYNDGSTDRAAAFSRSQSLMLRGENGSSESYLDRLAWSFHAATESDFQINAINPVEVGIAAVFEGNAKGLIGLLRSWSLPIASAVAEIASLGGWLPPHSPSPLLGLGEFDADDLQVLGVDTGSPDEADGVRDATLMLYAQELANAGELAFTKDGRRISTQGWELAVQILGRMDSSSKSEETVGELLRAVLDGITAEDGDTVDKVWRLLNELGMIAFAEDTAESYGEILASTTTRYGDALHYYALAHRPAKVRDVLSLLISYSLIQSMAFPPSDLLDDSLRQLLTERNATLEEFAKQDVEAAELLGRMLSGYATLRKFYEIRDGSGGESLRRRQAAEKLMAVIEAADDGIRGGLFDPSRNSGVGEEFLGALLGEALVFVRDSASTNSRQGPGPASKGASGALTLDQIDVLLKAMEDLHAIGPRVSTAAEEFLQVVLASAPGVKGKGPADLMRSTTSAGSVGGSFVLSGSSMLASKLHQSIREGFVGEGGEEGDKEVLRKLGGAGVKRGWDWRSLVGVGVKGEEVVRRLRGGVARELAVLWLGEIDEGRG